MVWGTVKAHTDGRRTNDCNCPQNIAVLFKFTDAKVIEDVLPLRGSRFAIRGEGRAEGLHCNTANQKATGVGSRELKGFFGFNLREADDLKVKPGMISLHLRSSQQNRVAVVFQKRP